MDLISRGTKLTSIRRRLDNVLNKLSSMGTEPDEEASSNIAAQLSIIKTAFKESKSYPTCCFKYDVDQKVLCDVVGPLTMEEFMEQCRQCQAQIKSTLTHLETN
ncbi:MAG: hypothetical protein NWE99_10250 [Candidatus Bathyarchaeota archaeon]|nr:hypothetical protein [Candidatus Bathyarchaeota archaeon]